MSLLTIVQNVADGLGIARPSSVAGSSDQQTRQLHALVNREGQSLRKRHDWEALITEETHTTLAAELQGVVTTITGTDFAYIVNGSMWDRSNTRPVPGPLSRTQWQQQKSSNVSGPYSSFSIHGGSLYFLPAPVAGNTIAFFWVSKNWCTTADGVTGKASMTLDTDIAKLPEDIIELGVIWRWRKAKGFDYAEDYQEYEIQLASYIERDGGRQTLNMGDGPSPRGLVVPEGSWSL